MGRKRTTNKRAPSKDKEAYFCCSDLADSELFRMDSPQQRRGECDRSAHEHPALEGPGAGRDFSSRQTWDSGCGSLLAGEAMDAAWWFCSCEGCDSIQYVAARRRADWQLAEVEA